MRERLKIYWRDTRPMIEYYSARPTFRAIDGQQAPEQVREALVAAVASALGQAGEPVALADEECGVAGVIVCRSASEIEKLARVNALVARVLKELAAAVKPGVTTARARRAGRAAIAGSRRGAGVQGVSRLPRDDLRVGERAGGARHSVGPRAGRRRHRVDRHGREARRVLRRFGGHGAGGPRDAGSATAAAGDQGSPRSGGGHGAGRREGVGHRRGGAVVCRGAGVFGGPRVRGPRRSGRRFTKSRRFRITARRDAARGWRRA